MKYRHLSLTDRYNIESLLNQNKTQKYIADFLGVDKSTISRELRRNKNAKGGYAAKGAQANTKTRRRCRADYKRKVHGVLEIMVREKLGLGWSPELISNRLKKECKGDVSHESIYNFIEYDKRFGGELYKCLRFHNRRKKRGINHRWKKFPEPRKFIDKRPEVANKRERSGDWERDLIIGKRGKSALLTIVDRKSHITLIKRVTSTQAEEVAGKTLNAFRENPDLPLFTITNDNGAEFGKHQQLEMQLKIPIYFTFPYHSWERGTNENTNGLIRQFFPKKTNFDDITDKEIKEVETILNNRPRKLLNYLTPLEFETKKYQKAFHSEKYYHNLHQTWLDEHYRNLDEMLGL